MIYVFVTHTNDAVNRRLYVIRYTLYYTLLLPACMSHSQPLISYTHSRCALVRVFLL